jgi:hypothetical protein
MRTQKKKVLINQKTKKEKGRAQKSTHKVLEDNKIYINKKKIE